MKKLMSLLLAAVLILTFGAFALASGSSDEPKKESNSSGGSSSTQEKEETFGVNETAVFDNIKITATEIKESKGAQYFEPTDGNVYVGVNFTIENISDEEQIISSILLFDAYVDDVSTELSINASMAFDGNGVDGTIAPGKKIVGWYTMEVPADWQKIELDVASDWISSAKARFVFSK